MPTAAKKSGKDNKRSAISDRRGVLIRDAADGVTGCGANVHHEDEEGAANRRGPPRNEVRPAFPCQH